MEPPNWWQKSLALTHDAAGVLRDEPEVRNSVLLVSIFHHSLHQLRQSQGVDHLTHLNGAELYQAIEQDYPLSNVSNMGSGPLYFETFSQAVA